MVRHQYPGRTLGMNSELGAKRWKFSSIPLPCGSGNVPATLTPILSATGNAT